MRRAEPEGSPVAYGSARGRWILLATVLGSGMTAIDATVVGIALPRIGKEFHAPLVDLQWVVSGYLLALASLLLVGGVLGDVFGRRRVFMVGTAWFTIASVACALAPNPGVLVAMRFVQGIGGALLVPGSLALIEASFDGPGRGAAVGAWSGLGGIATALGPLVGGWLITVSSWRWIFLLNVPLGCVVLAVAARHVPESRRTDTARHLDMPGALLVSASLAALTFGLTEVQSLPAGVVAFALGGAVLAGVGFVLLEARVDAPLVPLTVLRVRTFVVTNGVTLLVYAALGGVLFLLPVELQVTDRYSPLQAGISLLPVTFVMLALSSTSGRLAASIGPRLQMSVGPIVVALGIVLLSRSAGDASYLTGVLPGVLVLAFGLAATVAPLTSTALAALPADHAGLASAVNNDVARTGGLLAVALLPAIVGISGRSYLHPSAMGSAFRATTFVTAVWCAAGGVLAALLLPSRVRRHAAGVPCLHCGLDATPAVTDRVATTT